MGIKTFEDKWKQKTFLIALSIKQLIILQVKNRKSYQLLQIIFNLIRKNG